MEPNLDTTNLDLTKSSPVITSTTQKRKRKIYHDITNESQCDREIAKDEFETDQRG